MQKLRQGGFTLIEIMIVIVIIGVLATLVVPRVIDRPDQAREIKAAQDIRTIQAAIQMYKLDNYTYPSEQQGLAALIKQPTSGVVPKNWNGPYLEKTPEDPWGNAYLYRNPGKHGAIDIYSFGADGVEGGEGAAKDLGNWD